MNNKTIIVTGGNGFIGKHLIGWLNCKYPSTRIISTVRRNAESNSQHVVNLNDLGQVKSLIKEYRPDYFFHAAGVIQSDKWDDFYVGNVQTTFNILEGIRVIDPFVKVVLLGSAAEYGKPELSNLPLSEDYQLNPTSLYGLSKTCQTSIAQYYNNVGLNVIVARLFNVYGSGISKALAIGSFLSQIVKISKNAPSSQIVTGPLNAKRDYLYIDDVSSALVCLAQKGSYGEIYNVCSGQSVSMRWLLQKMIEYADIKTEIDENVTKRKNVDVDDIYGSYSKIAALGWRPEIGLDIGIRTMVTAKYLGNE